MKKWNLVNKILFGAWALLTMTQIYAGIPLWTFEPLTATTISVTATGTANIKYRVTNQSKKSHTLSMRLIPGITQVTTGSNCSSPFVLAYQQSCTLSLSVNGGSLSGNVVGGPVVCQGGNPLQCYQPSQANSLNITKISSFTVGGTVTGLTGTVTLLNNNTNATPISTDGSFTFSTPIANGSTYSVTVGTQPVDQTCTVFNGKGTINDADVTNVVVTCNTNTSTVGGTVSGLLTGRTVVLLNNDTNPTPRSTNGAFTFSTPIAEGSPYAVTVETQPVDQTCSVANGTGIIGAANVTNVVVTCAINTFTVGGNVTGLISGGTGTVTLLNNGTNPTPISTNSGFVFSTPIADGSPYAVTVGIQPIGQTCTVANGTGTITGANVTNVAVTCITANTTLSVSTTGTIPVTGIGTTNTFTVTNSGTTYDALNVHAVLPSGWTQVTQDRSNCLIITPGNSCNLLFSSTAPYIAQGNITITGDNITSPPTTALAFTDFGYLIWRIVGAQLTVIDTINTPPSPELWGRNVVTRATSLTNGFTNTAAIVAEQGVDTYAAYDCYQSTNGGADPGSWYLPAICEMGVTGTAGCALNTANIEKNLVQYGFGGLDGYYWSSTQSSLNPLQFAWAELFDTISISTQNTFPKTFDRNVRCARYL